MKHIRLFEGFEYYYDIDEWPDMEPEQISFSEYNRIQKLIENKFYSYGIFKRSNFKLKNYNGCNSCIIQGNPFSFTKYQDGWWLVIYDKLDGSMQRWYMCDHMNSVVKLLMDLSEVHSMKIS